VADLEHEDDPVIAKVTRLEPISGPSVIAIP
jgi:hypothetical protein